MQPKAEYSGDYNELLYLRARYYAPTIGRFLTRDTWTGVARQPMSYNKWLYVYSNPINLIDPTGFDPNCMLLPRGRCAIQRFEEILKENGTNGASTLVAAFEDTELFSLWGGYAGRTSGKRLEWLLGITRGLGGHHVPFLPVNFAYDCGIDYGFSEEFRDSQLYPQWYGSNTEHRSDQVSHFLTAVTITYYHWHIGLIIGHEKVPDGQITGASAGVKAKNYFSYLAVTDQEIKMFHEAVELDKQGLDDQRDQLLWAILNFDEDVESGQVESYRDGNSLQDFRLSLKGFRFAQWVQENNTRHPSFAASWLRSNLMPLSTIPRPPR